MAGSCHTVGMDDDEPAIAVGDFFLVQRLARTRVQPDPARGFDGFVELDYMGSSEFEYGAPRRAFEAITSTGPLTSTERLVTHADTTKAVFFVHAAVLTDAELDERITALSAWLGAGCPGDGWTRFAEQFLPDPTPLLGVRGWWAFGAKIAWTFDEEFAAILVTAFNTPLPARTLTRAARPQESVMPDPAEEAAVNLA